jgi:hypothetical protein
MPQNVQQQVELAVAASLVATEEPRSGRPPNPDRLRALLSQPPVHRKLPHQVPNLLTGAITSSSGSHTVFPGWEEDSDWVLARLLEAVDAVGSDDLNQRIRPLEDAVLRICDALASRAGLHRHQPGTVRPLQPVDVPAYATVQRLAAAARFTEEDLATIAGGEWHAVLAPLITTLPASAPGRPGGDDPFSSSLLWRPLVVAPAGGLIVAVPGFLLIALRHAIVCHAIELGLTIELEEAFNGIVAARALQALAGLGLVAFTPATAEQAKRQEASYLLPIDTDKALHLLVLGEDLGTYDPDDPFSKCTTLPDREALEERLTEIEEGNLAEAEPLNGIVHIVAPQTMGRGYDVMVKQPGPPMFSPRPVMSVAELEVLSSCEDPDLLLLWRFGHAVSDLRSHVPLQPISQLDEFVEWRNSGHSFASLRTRIGQPDEPVLLLPGSARELREEVAERFDRHGTPGPSGELVEVERYLEDPAIPLYKPSGRIVRPDFMVSPYGEGKLWVVAGDLPKDPREWEEPRRWTELIAYWLWKLRPRLDDLASAIEASPTPVAIVAELEPGSAGPADDLCAVEVEDGQRVRLRIRLSRAQDAFGETSNEAERMLIAEVLAATGRAVGADEDFSRARELTRRWMSPRVRKLIFTRRPDPAVRPISMPPRFLSPADVDTVMHSVGEALVDELGLEPGPVPAERTHQVLNLAVQRLFEHLQRRVGALGNDRLLDWLVSANEALVGRGVIRGMELASELACYGSESDIVERRLEQSAKLATASVANRFLIEYVAAQPPFGLRPISYSAYDELLAISSQIVELGTLSDLLKYELAEIETFILPTGRLVAAPTDGHRAALRAFAGNVASGDVRRSAADLEQRLAGSEVAGGEKDPGEDLLEAGFLDEFGFGFEQAIRGLYALCETGMDSSGAITMEVEEVTDLIAREIGDSQAARRLVATFALTKREDFFPAPAGFNKEDLYPWRFNRRLSYLRRPLLIDGAQATFGPAGVFRAITYLDDLIGAGRLTARSPRLKKAVSKIQFRRGEEFNDRVAALYEGRDRCRTWVRVKKVGSAPIERRPGEPLGDVDVLVVAAEERSILAIETKALAVALTPHQLHNEIAETFDPAGRSALVRHGERCEWLERHVSEVLAQAGLSDQNLDEWHVLPLVAVDEEVFSPLLRQVETTVRSWQELVRAGEEGKLF